MNFYLGTKKPMVLALGFFDGVHLGHKTLIEKAKGMLDKGDTFALFTIDGTFFKNQSGNIFSTQEREQIFKSYGVEKVLIAKATKRFFNLSSEKFLHILSTRYNLKGIVVGQDFTFGKNASGKVKDIMAFCKNKNIKCQICPIVYSGNQKISATVIKEFLKEGKIEQANQMLGQNYFITGKVVHGRGEGGQKLFPTANVTLSNDKFKLRYGVYATKTEIDGVKYNSVTNYGSCPTFNQEGFTVESFILNYQGNLYGKQIKTEFLSYLRDITKFSSIEELKKQIRKDTEYFL